MHDHPAPLRVLRALTACLEEISVANGYRHDLADAVFRGRDLFGDSDPVPMVSILEPPSPPDQLRSPDLATENFGEWDLLIQGFADEDPEHPTDPAHFLMADVKRRLAREKKRRSEILVMGNDQFGIKTPNGVSMVEKLTFGRGVVRPPDGVISNKAFFWLTVTLSMSEDNEDPYA